MHAEFEQAEARRRRAAPQLHEPAPDLEFHIAEQRLGLEHRRQGARNPNTELATQRVRGRLVEQRANGRKRFQQSPPGCSASTSPSSSSTRKDSSVGLTKARSIRPCRRRPASIASKPNAGGGNRQFSRPRRKLKRARRPYLLPRTDAHQERALLPIAQAASIGDHALPARDRYRGSSPVRRRREQLHAPVLGITNDEEVA